MVHGISPHNGSGLMLSPEDSGVGDHRHDDDDVRSRSRPWGFLAFSFLPHSSDVHITAHTHTHTHLFLSAAFSSIDAKESSGSRAASALLFREHVVVSRSARASPDHQLSRLLLPASVSFVMMMVHRFLGPSVAASVPLSLNRADHTSDRLQSPASPSFSRSSLTHTLTH